MNGRDIKKPCSSHHSPYDRKLHNILNILSSRLVQKYLQHLWLKINTTVLYHMETTQSQWQTKVSTRLKAEVSHQVRSSSIILFPYSLSFPQVPKYHRFLSIISQTAKPYCFNCITIQWNIPETKSKRQITATNTNK